MFLKLITMPKMTFTDKENLHISVSKLGRTQIATLVQNLVIHHTGGRILTAVYNGGV